MLDVPDRAMKTTITLKLDAELIRSARFLAAQQGLPLSAFVAQKLREIVEERKQEEYDIARRSALERLRKGYELHWTPPRSRDELHER